MTDLDKDIEQVINNHTEGSTEICNLLIKVIKVNVTSTSMDVNLLNTLKSKFNHFPVVLHFLNFITPHCRDPQELKTILLKYEDEWKDINFQIAEKFIERVSVSTKRVLLHSLSSTVLSMFDFFRNKKLKVDIYQTESRPNMEGRLQAKQLAEWGYPVHLITDALAMQYIRSIDMVIIGADAILPTDIINKTGSLGICIAAKHFNKPVYVVSDSRKITDQYISRTANSSEIWSDFPGNINVINEYFEKVPKSLITEIITN